MNRSAVFQLHQQNARGQAQGDDVGDHDGPSADEQAVNQPQRHANREAAVHAQRNTADIAGAEGFEGLGHEAEGGQEGGEVADDVDEGHGICY
jgi:hypothetical protein